MPGSKKHLHIDDGDMIATSVSKMLKTAKSGAITIDFADEPAVKVTANNGRIAVDLLQPTIFKVPEDETGLFDKLRTASEFASKLSDDGVTLSILRRGKEVIRLGKDSRPTFSRLITRSKDIQMSSMTEFARLKKDFKAD
ncbi:hypothetical protein NTE_00574 [Candidatus Nitrososphaera evergladensis SR1]|uniref:Uncharacterized protein n=2 Tax=Nitrososphaera TaxID=497726 RepID=A0A075MNC2_9ARCH|nr:hypothetical protein NTE_00574 [Candidatus Nitrososphaera evergladensis SR1]